MIGSFARLSCLLVWVALCLTTSLGWAQSPPARGKLEVRVSETRARVLVDGKLMGSTPLAAPLELAEGEHVVVVDKPGFERVTERVTIEAGKTAEIDVRLEAAKNTGKLRVTSREEPLRVVVDGVDVGVTPFEGAFPAGEHQVEGRSPSARAEAVSVTITAGETVAVELATRPIGKLEVRVDGGGAIEVDGEKVGEDRFVAEVAAGTHRVRVTREGYEPAEKTIEVAPGDVHVETVTLRKRAAGQIEGGEVTGETGFNGVYGGLKLLGMFEPTGSGNTLERSCETIGAASCDGGTPMGVGIGGYIGYAFAPVGLELLILGAGDVNEPAATFDGQKGSDINPLVATPAREERFIIGRFGGGGALRLRLLHPIDRFRITGALGAGAVYRHLVIGRDTETEDGQTSSVTPEGAGYLSAVLNLEIGGQVVLTGTTALSLGFELWLEHAGSDTHSEPDHQTILTGGDGPPRPQATPAYDLAAGTQLFMGPVLGIHFGP